MKVLIADDHPLVRDALARTLRCVQPGPGCECATLDSTESRFAALPPLFFDLEADPHCLNDLSRDPASAPAMSNPTTPASRQRTASSAISRLRAAVRIAEQMR